MSFCCAGTRPSRRSAQTRRIYVGKRRMRSTTSATSFGARILLANVDLSLREPCPQRAKGLGHCGIAIGGPEREKVLRLPVGHAAQLDRRRRLRHDAGGLREGRADLLGG